MGVPGPRIFFTFLSQITKNRPDPTGQQYYTTIGERVTGKKSRIDQYLKAQPLNTFGWWLSNILMRFSECKFVIFKKLFSFFSFKFFKMCFLFENFLFCTISSSFQFAFHNFLFFVTQNIFHNFVQWGPSYTWVSLLQEV
jgi:hypothetical protein